MPAVTNASRTQMMSLETCTWYEPFFEHFSMRPSALPRIVTNSEASCLQQIAKADPLIKRERLREREIERERCKEDREMLDTQTNCPAHLHRSTAT